MASSSSSEARSRASRTSRSLNPMEEIRVSLCLRAHFAISIPHSDALAASSPHSPRIKAAMGL
eukprot:scaffold304_cov248-Pinguiococcus_pyrenoidosus.AAC.21